MPPHSSVCSSDTALSLQARTTYNAMYISPYVSLPINQSVFQFGTMFPSTTIKHHFNVSNSYVIHKIKLVLFPWTHKPWSRRLRRSEQGQSEWQNPREDINSPDLYIPGTCFVSNTCTSQSNSYTAMAVVTYILLCALHAGLQKQFHTKVRLYSSPSSILTVHM